jgi:predicted DNA-binding protein with PD1-like motif
MRIEEGNPGRLFVVRLEPGDDILEGLNRFVDEKSIKNAAIINGVGSAARYHLHVVETTNLPPGNIYFKADGAFDILSVAGLVMSGRVHAHITLSDDRQTYGGHLETGCEVLTFCIVMIQETPDMDLADLDKLVIPE